MIGALWTGISGLSTAQSAIDNESNNISNVNTVAYKASRVSFADQMYQNSIGKGTTTANVQKIYETGGTQSTGIAYDVALDDDGFFTVADTSSIGSPEIYYTRAGNFLQGEDGTLQTNEGYEVQGWAVSTTYEYERTNPNLLYFTDDYNTLAANQIIYNEDSIDTVTAKVTDYNESATAITNATNPVSSAYGTYNKTAAAVIQDVEALMTAYSTALSTLANDPSASSVTPIAQTSTIDLSTMSANMDETEDYITVYIDGEAKTVKFDTDADTTYQNLADTISEIEGLRASYNSTTDSITIESLVPGDSFILGTISQYDHNGGTATTYSSADTTYTVDATQTNPSVTINGTTYTGTNYSDLINQLNNINGITASITGATATETLTISKSSSNFTLSDITDTGGTTTANASSISTTYTAAQEGAGEALAETVFAELKSAVESAGAEIFQITSTINQKATQSSLQLDLKTLGITNSNGGEYDVNDKGVITITQDGATYAVGQISVATFKANDGLNAVGNNIYEATQDSGDAMYATNNNGKATISNEQLELSTADLSESLVNLMVYQRAFEANSKSITTSDELLDTLINLKR